MKQLVGDLFENNGKFYVVNRRNNRSVSDVDSKAGKVKTFLIDHLGRTIALQELALAADTTEDYVSCVVSSFKNQINGFSDKLEVYRKMRTCILRFKDKPKDLTYRQKLIGPKDYNQVLVPNLIRDWAQMYSYQGQHEEGITIEPVILTPSKKYGGLLIIDGLHRVYGIGAVEGSFQSLIIDSDEARTDLERLQEKEIIKAGGILFGEFVDGIISLDDLVRHGENNFREIGNMNLKQYLRE